MLPIVIVVFAAWLSISSALLHGHNATARLNALVADTAAMNFLNYRQSVAQQFRVQNPLPAGQNSIAQATLVFPPGFIPGDRWANLIVGGQLYCYSVAPLTPNSTSVPPLMLDAVYQQSGRHIMVGIKLEDGNLSGPPVWFWAGLPKEIPVGSIVYIGG